MIQKSQQWPIVIKKAKMRHVSNTFKHFRLSASQCQKKQQKTHVADILWVAQFPQHIVLQSGTEQLLSTGPIKIMHVLENLQ